MTESIISNMEQEKIKLKRQLSSDVETRLKTIESKIESKRK
jgi:hypothetical protein